MRRILIFCGISLLILLTACHQEPVEETFLAVSSTPQGAKVYIEDTLTEYKTDCVIPDIEPGEYEISLKLYDLPAWSAVAQVQAGETTKVDGVFPINEGKVKWVYSLGDNYYGYQPAIGPKGTVYLHKGDLFALNPDGSLKWTYSAEGGSKWATVASDGSIYLGQTDNEVAKITALTSSGSPIWEYQADSADVVSSIAMGKDGTLYFSAGRYWGYFYLYALTSDGSLKWKKEVTGVGSPVVGTRGTIYLGCGDYLYAFHPNGSLKWAFQDGTTPAIGSDRTLYLASGNDLCALDPNGRLKWRHHSSGTFNPPSIGNEGKIYVTNTVWEWEEDEWGDEWRYPVDASLYCFSSSGNVLWKSNLAQWSESTPTVGSDGSIYATTWESVQHKEIQSLYAFDSEGIFMWKCQGPSTTSSPAVGNDGTIYVYGYSNFYAIQSSSFGLASSSWPKYGHDNQNTGSVGGP